MADLSPKIIGARRRWIEVPGHPAWGLELQRPTDYDLSRIRGRGLASGVEIAVELCKAHVVGWRGITEADLVPGGGGETPAFDPRTWAAFIEDRPDLWGSINDAIWAAVRERERELETLRGN